ncbi:TlpA family protein disulfide reductase [Bacteroidales bacterium OttesenSCG-928-M06]|nr:TlpA family protein disulfide reductase [Bacteroidales bacterium OttesenSCG-928-M06]
MYRFIIIHVFLLVSITIFAQSASITFVTDKERKVQVYKVVDGQYTLQVIDKEFYLTPEENVVYETAIDEFKILRCNFENEGDFDIFLTPGDSLVIKNLDSKIVFEGDGAEEASFFALDYINYVRPLARLIVSNSSYDKIKSARDSCLSKFNEDIDHIEKTKFTPLFREIAKKSIKTRLDGYCANALLGNLKLNHELTTTDSIKITNMLDTIFNEVNIYDKDLYKTQLSDQLLSCYLQYTYDKLNDQEIEELFKKKGIEKEAYGQKHKYFVIASDKIECLALGNLIYYQYLSHKEDINKEKLYTYYKNKYGDSDYLYAINELITQIQIEEEKKQLNENIIFIDEEISLLKDLSKLPFLKDKYIFIDLWATWCAPCIREFQYKENLIKLLDAYNHIAIVYISIDDDDSNNHWKIKVSDYNLEGYNLRASSQLRKDIEAKLFNYKNISVPRYVLLDKNGEILDSKLPKPSKNDELKKVLDSLFIKN